MTITTCFLLDDCSDASAAILAGAASWFPFEIRVTHAGPHGSANAGRARRAAMAMGVKVMRNAAHGWLLTTDADSRPRPDWVVAAGKALAHADVAAGRIVRDDGANDPVQSRLEDYYDSLHRCRRIVDPVEWDDRGCSHFTGGANLAFRADAYRALGGFAPLPSGEDARLLDDASRAGFRVRRDPDMIVDTSSRRDGRALAGLAASLRGIDRDGLPMVAHPAAALWQYGAQARARRAFAGLADPILREELGASLGLSSDHLLGVARDCPNGEAFAMRIVPAAPIGGGAVPLDEAESALRAWQCGPAVA